MISSTELVEAPRETGATQGRRPPEALAPARRPSHDTPSSLNASTTEFLAFKLGSEEYGIDILRVQEIRSFEKPMHIPSAPPHILGVVNLRGLIVPIVDLRIRFAIAPLRYDASTVVIVLNIGARVIGIVVDAVSDVIPLMQEQMHAVPEFGPAICSEHLLAIGTLESRMLILVDIERLMTGADMGLVDLNLHQPTSLQ